MLRSYEDKGVRTFVKKSVVIHFWPDGSIVESREGEVVVYQQGDPKPKVEALLRLGYMELNRGFADCVR